MGRGLSFRRGTHPRSDKRAPPVRPCPRPARRSPGRAPWPARRRRSRTPASARPETARSAPAAAASPTARSAGSAGIEGGPDRASTLLLCRGLPRSPDQVLEPLQRQRQMAAPLGLRDRVDLVDDHRLGRGEDLADRGGEHQVERLGRGDEDVGRRFLHRPPLGLGRVAGPQPDRDVRADPAQRRPQVALDVVGERLQRRDVDEPHPGAAARGSTREAVDPPEEAGQGLAGAGRGADQRVGAAGDRLPAPRLGRRRPLEGGLEPAPHRRAERRQRVGLSRSVSPRWPTHRSYASAAAGSPGHRPRARPTARGCRRRTSRRRTRTSSARSRRRRGRSRRRSCRCPAASSTENQ